MLLLALPSYDTICLVKACSRAILKQLRQPDNLLRPLLDGLSSRCMICHVRGGITRVAGVDFDFRFAKIVRKVYREHIERRFRRVIGQELDVVKRIARIGVDGQGTQTA